MKFNKKVFEAKNPFVKMFVREVLRKSKTIEQVPDIGNLREVVSAEVDRIERNSQESHKSTEAPKEVVTSTPTVSEAPKETIESERKEEHAE